MSEFTSVSSEPLEEKLKNLPEASGVYLFKDKQEKIIYVGKAKVLKNRVRSYFQKNSGRSFLTGFLIGQIYNLDWIVTLSDSDAYLLEDRLIKLHKPKYNIRLKDDKSYPFIKFTLKETFPRLFISREFKEDGNAYFGPYNSPFEARILMNAIRKNFPLRTSKMDLDGTQQLRPCLNFQIGRCLGPCRGTISPETYGEVVQHILQIFRGKFGELLEILKAQMEKESEKLEFERAALIRDQIRAVESIRKKSHKISEFKTSLDVFQIIRRDGHCGIQVLFVRYGFLMKSDFFHVKESDFYEDEELLRSAFSNIYLGKQSFYPEEILVPIESEKLFGFEDYFYEKKNRKLKIRKPSRGEGRKLLLIAQKNAEQNIHLAINNTKSEEGMLKEVQKTLHLKNLPRRTECFDISNTSGMHSVASMVVAENGNPQKKDYRKFRVKTTQGPDDFESMREVLQRRLERAKSKDWPMPDLIIIDGGKGQVNAVSPLFQEMKEWTQNTDLIGLAKGRSEKKLGKIKEEEDYEYVVKPNQKNTIALRKQSLTLHFLTRIRDEAHRFGINYHRKERGKAMVASVLDEIPNIGAVKKKSLLKTFRGIEKIKSASLEELAQTPKISGIDAETVYHYFHPPQPPNKK